MMINTQGWSWASTSPCDYLNSFVVSVCLEFNEEGLLWSSLITKWCWKILPLSDLIWSCHRCVYLEILITTKMDEEPDKKQVWVVCLISLSPALKVTDMLECTKVWQGLSSWRQRIWDNWYLPSCVLTKWHALTSYNLHVPSSFSV